MDPFRDDQTALRIRVDELEQRLVDKREELARIAEPHAALAKALKQSEERASARAEEVEALESKLADLRAAIERARGEHARITEQLHPKKK